MEMPNVSRLGTGVFLSTHVEIGDRSPNCFITESETLPMKGVSGRHGILSTQYNSLRGGPVGIAHVWVYLRVRCPLPGRPRTEQGQRGYEARR